MKSPAYVFLIASIMNGQRKSKTLLAIKAISLEPNLLGNDRRVACALIEHFNRETGRCDPSLARIASLVGISVRTVIRAIDRLVAAQLFRRLRHGGLSQRNSYQPNWARFDSINEEWRRRLKQSSLDRASMSPASCQEGHLQGAAGDTQTCSSNLSYSTEDAGRANNRAARAAVSTTMELKDKISHKPAQLLHVKSTSSRDAAREAAQRRWDNDLLLRFRHHAALYGRLVELIDKPIADAATAAELQRRHAGAEYVLRAIAQRDPGLAAELERIAGGRQ